MTEFPEIERLREQAVGVGDTIDGRRPRVVRLPDAEQAVRDAVERGRQEGREVWADEFALARREAIRECVEALRERSNASSSGQEIFELRRAARFLERTMLGGEDD